MPKKPMTSAQKILARVSGKDFVEPGEVIWVDPDLLIMYAFPTLTDEFARILKEDLHVPIRKPNKCKLFIDHMMPPAGVKESEFHQLTRDWAAELGVELIDNLGIGHQVTAELGWAKPGMFIAHSDLHVQPLGAFNVLTVSLLTDIITPYALGKFWMQVPETIRIELKGHFSEGIGGRDLINRILGDLGPDGGLNTVLEFVGEGAENMSIDDRMTSLSEVVFCGAYGGIYPAGKVVDDFLVGRTDTPYEAAVSDIGAQFLRTLTYDLSKLEPTLVAPSGLTSAISIEEAEGLPVNQGYIGSCASGRVTDLEIAAKILRGKKIKDSVRLYVVPSSKEILAQVSRSGVLADLVEAGAFISSPSCDYCYGKVQSIHAGERAISTGTLNVPGRLGSTEAEIYLSGAAVVASSVLTGEITDPRKFLR
ncbi:MAG: 3-isopropylmalate dehydratase large subunit [Sphaerochaetaceae bacterium]